MDLFWTIQSLTWQSALDIFLVAMLIFGASFLVRSSTQATPVMRGLIAVIILIGFLSSVLNLPAFNWILRTIITATAVAIPVIFQPELRKALERLGRTNLGFRQNTPTQREIVIDAICKAVERLSERRHGALIVLERRDNLREFISTGVSLNSEISPQLLLTIFWPKTELHDGAVIIQGNRLVAAACVLPLSSGRKLTERKLGTRHRASLGMSEVSDAVVVTVSEETGQISVSNRGRMIRQLDARRLATILSTFYTAEETPKDRWRLNFGKVRQWIFKRMGRSSEGQEQSEGFS
jgi:diadenylate cyclase